MTVRTVRLLSIAFTVCVAPAAHAQDGRLIGIDGNRSVYQLDINTAARTLVGTLPTAVGTAAGLALDCSSGTLYLTSSSTDSLYTVDPVTWSATLIGSYGDSTIVMHGLEWDSSTGTLYGGSGGNLYTINTTTGQATLIGPSGLGTSFLNLGYDPTTDTLYATYATTDSLYTIDRQTGAATLIGSLNGPTNPHGFAWNKDNQTMYLVCSSTDSLYTVDLSSGSASIIGALGSGNYLGLVYLSNTPGCGGEPACPGDFNNSGSITVQDIFDYLTAYFSNDAAADINDSGSVTVQDIFDYLTAYFEGCG